MLFNSITFFLFFIVVTILYFWLPYRFRCYLLLAASYFFYMSWTAEYAVLLLFLTATSYFCAIYIEKASSKTTKRTFLIISLCITIGFLFAYKYFYFFIASLFEVLNYREISFVAPKWYFIMPVGISFYTFRIISYVLDIYHGRTNPEKSFVKFALYVSFFPSLLAGPIDRAIKLLPQFYKEHPFNIQRISVGVTLMMWGLFKKVVIADRLGMYVDSIFSNVPHHYGPSFILASYLYTFQIYCDFSGYSDMAIGFAKILGFDLMQNFNLPYFAITISDFWQRWHISLSTWFRDYLYIPLGGNRKGNMRTYLNLLITMIVCGLWHGAEWTFVLWGTLHGIILCLSRLTLEYRDKFYKRIGMPLKIITLLRAVITFNIVNLLWIVFRANSVNEAIYIIGHLFSGWPDIFIETVSLSHGILGVLVLIVVEFMQRQGTTISSMQHWPLPVRWCIYCAAIFSIILLGVDTGSQFIYFQF